MDNARQTELPGKREVDLYVQTYLTLLRTSGPVPVATLIPAHLQSAPLLHQGANEPDIDAGAFLYSTLRLPREIVWVEHILFGQSVASFARHGYRDILSWRQVTAPGRRRRWYTNDQGVLAAFVSSSSDLDDVVPTIVAWQIEWNKLHRMFEENPVLRDIVRQVTQTQASAQREADERLREALGLSAYDWGRLAQAWGEQFWAILAFAAEQRKRLTIQLLPGGYAGYTRAARTWWTPIERYLLEHQLMDRPLFFVSSNMHSIANVLSGTARRRQDALVRFIEQTRHPELYPELERFRAGQSRSNWDNLLYYTARLYFAAHPEEREARNREEAERGIVTINPEGPVDVGVQIITLSQLSPEDFDPRLGQLSLDRLAHCQAVILNINYPLGMGAYHLLHQIVASTERLVGVYILGKAATLNARIGDVMLSDVVYDEHSGNTYWLRNCFSAADLRPYLIYGSALDHQRAVTVFGTYLQNRGYLDFFYRENFTVVEMEAGPYLSALYEDLFLTRYGTGEQVNLTAVPFDLGLIHYASDTPYSRAHTLGARGLSYYGMDSTYASTIVILRRIFRQAGVLIDTDHASDFIVQPHGGVHGTTTGSDCSHR